MRFLAALLFVSLIALPALQCDSEPNTSAVEPEELGPTETEDPYAEPDSTWLSLSGTVESVDRDRFLLDYGSGHIIVEMDDGDRDADIGKVHGDASRYGWHRTRALYGHR